MVLLYDGDCGFCTSSAMWLASRLPEQTEVCPWQAVDLDDYGLSVEDVTTAAYWSDDGGRSYRGHLGIGQALATGRGVWKLAGRLIANPPVAWVAGPIYRLIASNRYRLPGSTDACRLTR